MDSADVIGTSLTRTKDYSHWLAFRALHAEFWEMLIRASNWVGAVSAMQHPYIFYG
jgi:hypothetical protein